MTDVLILIPARMAATRLPGKPLADIAGTPMIVRVLRRAEAAAVGPVVVATDSPEIETVVHKAGGRAVMTRADHASGSDRIFEALGKIDPGGRATIVVNVQGDLPTLEPSAITAAVALLADISIAAPTRRTIPYKCICAKSVSIHFSMVNRKKTSRNASLQATTKLAQFSRAVTFAS